MNNNQNNNSNNNTSNSNKYIFEKEYKNGISKKPTLLTTLMMSSNKVGTIIKVSNAMPKITKRPQE